MIRVEAGATEGAEAAAAETVKETFDGLERFYDKVLGNVVGQLKTEIAETRPPAKKGGPMRHALLGHWASVTGTLARAYRHVVKRVGPGELEPAVINDDPGGYGATLERRATFFVVHGVDDPGGPVDQQMAKALASEPDLKAF